MKKFAALFSAVIVSVAMMATVAVAADTWSACDVANVGPKGDIVRVGLKNCNQTPQQARSSDGILYLTLSNTAADQMMAAILTAMSLDKGVAIMTKGNVDSEGYGIAEAVMLSK